MFKGFQGNMAMWSARPLTSTPDSHSVDFPHLEYSSHPVTESNVSFRPSLHPRLQARKLPDFCSTNLCSLMGTRQAGCGEILIFSLMCVVISPMGAGFRLPQDLFGFKNALYLIGQKYYRLFYYTHPIPSTLESKTNNCNDYT